MKNYIQRVILRMLKLNTPSIQAQVEAQEGNIQDDVEVVQNYGFNAVPADNVQEGIILYVNGQADHGVVISWIDKANRPKIVKGEVQVYAKTPAGLSSITLKNDGSIEIKPANGIVKLTGKLECTGDVIAGNISLQQHTHPQNNGNHFGGGVNTGASQ
jgi:phage gp45-like